MIISAYGNQSHDIRTCIRKEYEKNNSIAQ